MTVIRQCTDEATIAELKANVRAALSTYSGEVQGTLLGLEQRTFANYRQGRSEGQANVAATLEEFHGYRMVQVSGRRFLSCLDRGVAALMRTLASTVHPKAFLCFKIAQLCFT